MSERDIKNLLRHVLLPFVAFFILALLLGCGSAITNKNRLDPYDNYIYPEFRPYIERFENMHRIILGQEIHISNLPIIIEFDDSINDNRDSDQPLRGAVCITTLRGKRIKVSEYIWDIIGTQAKEMLMMHELGHCVLGRDHSKSRTSVMFPTLRMRWDLGLPGYSAIWYELFKPGQYPTANTRYYLQEPDPYFERDLSGVIVVRPEFWNIPEYPLHSPTITTSPHKIILD